MVIRDLYKNFNFIGVTGKMSLLVRPANYTKTHSCALLRSLRENIIRINMKIIFRKIEDDLLLYLRFKPL